MSQSPFLGVDDKALQCQASLHPVYHGQDSLQVLTLSSSRSCVSVPPSSILPEYSPLAFISTRICQSSSSLWITLVALIDCGAQGNFISPSVIEKHLMDLVPKSVPLPVQMADGLLSRGGLVSHYAPVTLDLGGHQESLALDVTTTPHPIILGIPWLTKNNPLINWHTRTFTFPPKEILTPIEDPDLLRTTPRPSQVSKSPSHAESQSKHPPVSTSNPCQDETPPQSTPNRSQVLPQPTSSVPITHIHAHSHP